MGKKEERSFISATHFIPSPEDISSQAPERSS